MCHDASIIFFFCKNVPYDPNSITLSFVVFALYALENGSQNFLMRHNKIIDLIFLIVGHLEYRTKYYGIRFIQEMEQIFETYLPLKNVVYQYPQLTRIVFNNIQNIFLFSQNFVPCCDDGHLPNFREGGRNIGFELLLEILYDILVISVLLYLLLSSQRPQTFKSHMRIQLIVCSCTSFENGVAISPIKRDSFPRKRRQRARNRLLKRIFNISPGLRIIEILIAEFRVEFSLFLKHLFTMKHPDSLRPVLAFSGKLVFFHW